MNSAKLNAIERTFNDIKSQLDIIKPEGVRDLLLDLRSN